MVSNLPHLMFLRGFFSRLSLAGMVSILALTCAPAASQASTLIGNEIHGQYEFPNAGTIYGPSSVLPNPFVVGAGVETVFDIEGVTQLSIDFSASSLLITLTTTLTDPKWTTSGQNGPVFDVISGIAFPAITSVVASQGSVSAFLLSDKLYINFSGWSYHNGDTVSIGFDTSPVPLPAALPLFAAGLSAMGLMGWRKRRKAVAQP